MRSATVMQGFFRNKENMEGRVSGYWYWLLTLFVLQTILTIVFFLECWFSLLVLLYSLLISCTFTLLSAVSSVERAGGGEQEYTFGIWAGLGGAIGEEAWILFYGSGLRPPAWGEVQAGTTLFGFVDNTLNWYFAWALMELTKNIVIAGSEVFLFGDWSICNTSGHVRRP